MKSLNKNKKSYSNPSKLQVYYPAYNGPKLVKKQQGALSARSLSNNKKFGIRHLNFSPLSHASNQKHRKQQGMNKMNTINLTTFYNQNKLKVFTSPKINSTSNKLNKTNYFRSNNMNKVIQKMNSNVKQHKKTNPFKFHPIKKLAKGQYGSIYLAISQTTRFLAVIKCFNKNEVALNFLIDQIKIQMYCKHPNILPAYGFFFGKNQVYLIMEAGNHNLYSQIKRQAYFSEKKTANYLHQIMKGLSYLHLNGIIHRDLKPQNIIVCGNTLKISDFGWSIITEQKRTTFCGTMQYVSPEVSMGKPYDLKIDSWSIGVLAYEMLTGFPPFQVDSYNNKGQRPKLDYKKSVKMPCTISEGAKQFIKDMLNFDPEKRPTIAEGLRNQWIQLHNIEFKPMKKSVPAKFMEVIGDQ